MIDAAPINAWIRTHVYGPALPVSVVIELGDKPGTIGFPIPVAYGVDAESMRAIRHHNERVGVFQ